MKQVVERRVAWLRPVLQGGPSGRHLFRRRAALPPDPQAWDPLLLWGEDVFERGCFDWHPHRGFESITYMIEGSIEHRDTQGGHSTIGPGDVQWTTTGAGLMHEEQPPEGEVVTGLQLWLNLPASLKGTPPRYQTLRGQAMPRIEAPGVTARVFAGSVGGVTGPTKLLWPATFMDGALDGGDLCLDIDPKQALCVVGLKGALQVNGQTLPSDHAAWSGPGAGELRIEGTGRFVLAGGKPIGEPVVMDQFFAMNTQAELEQALADSRAGRFGRPPNDAAGS